MLSANDLYTALLEAYGEPRWWSDDPYMVLFQSVLVQNTSWTNVERTCGMIKGIITPEIIAGLAVDELEAMIRPCGLPRSKARTIKDLTRWYMDADSSLDTCRMRKELLAIKGIGEETADVILVYAFHRPSFIIDRYTRVLLARLGCSFRSESEVRAFFEDGLENDAAIYGYLHWLILDHCITRCRKKPECGSCPLSAICRKCI